MYNLIGACIEKFKAHHSLTWEELADSSQIDKRTLQNLVKSPPARHPKRWPQIVHFFGHQIIKGPDYPGPLHPRKNDPAVDRLMELTLSEVIKKHSPTLQPAPIRLEETVSRLESDKASLVKQRDALESDLKDAESRAKSLGDELDHIRKRLEQLKSLETEVRGLKKENSTLKGSVAQLESRNAKLKKLIAVYQEGL